MPRAFLFTNSRCKPEIKELINPHDYIIGVDGGINTLEEINLKPHIIIGDFDSAHIDNKFLLLNIKTITHEPEKDFTDTELALNYAIEEGFSPLIIVNSMQERIDHVLGVIASLRYLNNNNVNGLVIGDKQLFMILKKDNQFSLPINITISLIPLSDTVNGVTTKGLYYPLNNGLLSCDRALGISNVVSEEKVEIVLEEGELLFVVNFQEYQEVESLINSFGIRNK